MGQLSADEHITRMMQVRQGDESAFEALFEQFQQPVLNFFYRNSRNQSVARDLAQETFLRIWRIRKRYQATGSFQAYLFGIARLIWLEWCRREHKTWQLGQRQAAEMLADLPGSLADCPAYQLNRSEIRDAIQQALDQLPEEQRMVFVLRSIDGLALEDIAAILDCPVNTVRSRKILAVKKLRYLLGPLFRPADTADGKDSRAPLSKSAGVNSHV